MTQPLPAARPAHASASSPDKLLLRALRRESTERTPVWLMRQAGRYLPEYRAVRAQAGGFLAMVKDAELAAEVTLQPIRRFQMDAAILFSDILLPLEAMGMPLEFDESGPSLPKPLRTAADVAALRPGDPAADLAYVGRALELVRAKLPADVALLGFAGAPFTLASYAIEGGTSKSFLELKKLMYRDPATWEALLGRLADLVARHLSFQAEHGAEALVLFDTWAGTLTREDYRRYAAPWTARVVRALAGRTPLVLFAGQAEHLFEDQCAFGPTAVAVDHRSDLPLAFERARGRCALQGNLDPGVLLSTPEEVARRTRALLDSVRERRGHVLNVGHGVLPATDPECVAAFVECARGARP
jgi:uroporphyrinogen decarboxylase